MFSKSSYHIQIWIILFLSLFSNFCLNCFSDSQFTCLQVRSHKRFLILQYKVRGVLEKKGEIFMEKGLRYDHKSSHQAEGSHKVLK